MRIGIVSDTHDQVARTARAVRALVAESAEALIHCGDLTGVEVVYECACLPSYYVLGNNDFDEEILREAMRVVGGTCLGYGGEVTLAGRRIAVTHGDSTRELKRLAAGGPDYLLFGHSHVPLDDRDGPVRLVNPGALHRASVWTVALLDLASQSLEFLRIQ
jgi:putative phosphoesterase